MSNDASYKPFDGYRVLDFTQVVAGPVAAQLLGGSGADVIKIESRTGGDQMRGLFRTEGLAPDAPSGGFVAANRAKRSVAIDLKNPAGRDAVLRLAAQCDVVIENFRPGVIQRLGLGYDTVRELREDIVFCSISGFGQTGPLGPQSAYDGGIQAVSGMMSTTGNADMPPLRAGYLPVDVPTGLLAGFAISSALLRRERTGRGQYLDLAMLDTAMLLQLAAVGKYLGDGTISGRNGNASPARSPLADCFATRDGYLTISAVTAKHGEAALACLGLAENYWQTYLDSAPGSDTEQRISTEVRAAVASNTSDHWEPKLRALGMSVERVNTIDAAVSIARRQQRPVIDPRSDTDNETVSIGAAFVASEGGPARPGHAPELGEHTHTVFANFGFSDDEIAALEDADVISKRGE